VRRTLTLRLAPFERDALEAYGTSQRAPAERVVVTALMYYLRHRERERMAWRVSPSATTPRESGASLDVDVGEDLWQALGDEAATQGVSSESLATQALLFFLADVDSGRVAADISRVLRDN
jgi:hypothetical protein